MMLTGRDDDDANKPTSPSAEVAELGLLREQPRRSRLIKNAAKRKAHKICDRTMPISKDQKRSRWIPGKRYIIFLWIQYLAHPFVLLFRSVRGKLRAFEQHDDDYHNHCPTHRHTHRSSDLNQTIEAPDAQMKIVWKEHELLIE